MKFLEPAGLIVILILVVIIFFPRRLPDVGRPLRRRMTVFRENGEPVRSRTEAQESGVADKRTQEPDATKREGR